MTDVNSVPPAESNGECPPLDRATLLSRAVQRRDSRFDYIVVGSGAGGGPLACRLAREGMRVLLLEAGGDPAEAKSELFPQAHTGEVSQIPAYHGAATEEPDLSWQFSVRHFADDVTQAKDDKYNAGTTTVASGGTPAAKYPSDPRFLDPASRGGQGKGGIFYPRSSNLGGCTAHHAMIIAAPNDRDWNHIAQITGDESWRAGNMYGYFTKMERCLYPGTYDRWFRKTLGWIYAIWRRLVFVLNPRAVLDRGGHGTKGWQPTSFIDPALIADIARKDRGFLNVLARSALSVIHANRPLLRVLKKALFRLRLVQQLDPNDANTRRSNPEGVFLIPTGIEGDEKSPRFGHRVGVREYLLETQRMHPDRLVIVSGVHVTRVVFGAQPPQDNESPRPPRAIGVEFTRGDHLYEASPKQNPKNQPAEKEFYFVDPEGGEVVLSGGAFNTPQLLMLSGIGDAADLQTVSAASISETKHKSCLLRDERDQPVPGVDGTSRIHLPGVGRNLQDRYEVSVISELSEEFRTLQGISFAPGDDADPARRDWIEHKRGLYRTNGGTLAVLARSKQLGLDEPEPDIFAFGVPAAFRGYYWGWSRELLNASQGGTHAQRNLWSWVILKAYTQNHAGQVKLRTDNPYHTPEICFDSFNEHAQARAAAIEAKIATLRRDGLPTTAAEKELRTYDAQRADGRRDLEALVDAVRTMRAINACNPRQFVTEVQPGISRRDDSDELREWIRTQAWGHHCSCTCRIGSDPWQANPANLKDRGAVLDSHFKVHGVEGLRVVDASVFPKIPGYFILTPIFMVSEKAADTFLQERRDSAWYPSAIEEAEARAIHERRRKAHRRQPQHPGSRIPANTVGLALSGGGIRSATFALGLLQALAQRRRLREIDLLSTVSGGGFIGSFLGRLFTRNTVKASADPATRVEEILSRTDSAPLWWLRTNANYIFATGANDVRYNLAIFWRNVFTVHLVIGAWLFALFGLLAWLPSFPIVPALPSVRGVPLSFWAWLPLAALALGIIPGTLAYWLAPKPGSYRSVSPHALLAWVVLLASAAVALLIPRGLWFATGALVVLGLTWFWAESARWSATRSTARPPPPEKIGTLVRNRLTRALGETLTLFGFLIGWVVLDSLALLFAQQPLTKALVAVTMALGPLLPFLRELGVTAKQNITAKVKEGRYAAAAKLAGIPFAIFLVFVVDVLAHELVLAAPGWGWSAVAIGAALLFSLTIGRAFDLLNLTSLHSAYASRLTRTFQGASNEARVSGSGADPAADVHLSHPEDDIAFDRYHPEAHGGPLHLINVCVNETVDVASEREIRERKGLSMCLGPHGVCVGRNYFARWCPPDARPGWQKHRRWFSGIDGEDHLPEELRRSTALRALPAGSSPDGFHVLATTSSESAEVENLTLGAWTAISGAAYGTGLGRDTNLSLSLFLGLVNVRLGYWWDSGILARERPGRFPLSLWRRLKRLPVSLFRMQSMLVSEWRGRFAGPSQWFWYLTDGGHFEVTGAYELLRRRVPFIIVSDAGEDATYRWSDVAQLTRQVRTDFGADITWIDPAGAQYADVPSWIQDWLRHAGLTALQGITKSSPHHAALARVTYDRGINRTVWLLLLKPGVSDDLPQDVRTYGKENADFPQDSTFDQLFDDAQWESYRKLGQETALRVFTSGPPPAPPPPAPATSSQPRTPSLS